MTLLWIDAILNMKGGAGVYKYGFLRETKYEAIKAGKDADTGLHRTGLDEYLEVIFPGKVWVHDKVITGSDGKCIRIADKPLRIRPDYRCEELKLIIEYDGIPHYTKPDVILRDRRNTTIYENLGYKVVRIPFFIQLTNQAVKKLFGIEVTESLFPDGYPSLGLQGQNTPAYLCPLGLRRMAEEFRKFPDQYKTNIDFLRKCEADCPNNVVLIESKLLSDLVDTI